MQIKTTYWNNLKPEKVASLLKLVAFVNTINILAFTMLKQYLFLTTNLIQLTLLILIGISYKKWEKETWKKNKQ